MDFCRNVKLTQYFCLLFLSSLSRVAWSATETPMDIMDKGRYQPIIISASLVQNRLKNNNQPEKSTENSKNTEGSNALLDTMTGRLWVLESLGKDGNGTPDYEWILLAEEPQ